MASIQDPGDTHMQQLSAICFDTAGSHFIAASKHPAFDTCKPHTFADDAPSASMLAPLNFARMSYVMPSISELSAVLKPGRRL